MSTIAMRKPHADRGIEGLTAKWYAANTAEMMREFVELAQRISSQLPHGSAVLEVAPGPGYFCIELAKRGSYAIAGLDISNSMVKIATMTIPQTIAGGIKSPHPLHDMPLSAPRPRKCARQIRTTMSRILQIS